MCVCVLCVYTRIYTYNYVFIPLGLAKMPCACKGAVFVASGLKKIDSLIKLQTL